MKKLELQGGVTYEFDPNAVFEKDDRTFNFISIKKITTYKNNKKYQNLTIKPEHWGEFKNFLGEIIGNREPGDEEF